VYFLSRPRRFGKSLLISTLEALFKGKQVLFEGLWIEDKWDWTQHYPVILIDWTCIKHAIPEEMERSMFTFLKRQANTYQVTLLSEYASDCFAELIELLREKTGKKVVVLVDEYDVPILDAIGSPHEAMEKIRVWIHDFYKILKAKDEHLKFVFLTGVSKFSGLSVFSALNNLNDLTINAKYASICGYTQPELESYFSEHIDVTAKQLGMTRETLLEHIRYWYNGYTWDGETSVYNPFSSLLFFDTMEFAGYWFRTGTPTLLINILKQCNPLDVVLEPLLFQTGYLTIEHKELTYDGRPQYTLTFPNIEVRESLLEQLLGVFAEYPGAHSDNLKAEMQQHILDCDVASLEEDLRRMFACVPYELHIARESF
jgi:hypothetical protein